MSNNDYSAKLLEMGGILIENMEETELEFVAARKTEQTKVIGIPVFTGFPESKQTETNKQSLELW